MGEENLVAKIKNLFLNVKDVICPSYHLLNKDFNNDGKKEIMLCTRNESKGTIFYPSAYSPPNRYTSTVLTSTFIVTNELTDRFLILVKERKRLGNKIVFYSKDEKNPERYYKISL